MPTIVTEIFQDGHPLILSSVSCEEVPTHWHVYCDKRYVGQMTWTVVFGWQYSTQKEGYQDAKELGMIAGRLIQ